MKFVPEIPNVANLAQQIGIGAKGLVRLVALRERHYKAVRIPKKSGTRLLLVPDYRIKAVQAWVLRSILDLVPVSEYATAYRKGKGIAWNLGPHQHNRYFAKVDIKDFFPSISYFRVKNVFERLGYVGDVATILANIATVRGQLPQGGVTSPSLSNIILTDFDRVLGKELYDRGAVYTRYSDDIAISSNDPTMMPGLLKLACGCVRRYGFVVNRKKTAVAGPRSRVVVTGYVKDSNTPCFGIGRAKMRQVRAEIDRFCKGVTPMTYTTRGALIGYINSIRMINTQQYHVLRELLARRELSFRNVHANAG